ncbi:MAG: phosphatase PAP2 family protein [Clostridia bacterium]|nr:phosphatase PAP2 family protein [Clostridia bacterium]
MQTLFDPFLHFDLSVFQWVQTIHGGFLDKLMVIITSLGEGGIIFIAIALALLCTKKYRKAGVAIIVALLVMEVGNNLILKTLFARPRPFNLDPTVYSWWHEVYKFPELVSRPTSYSFPSGHTSSAFAAAIALLWYDRKFGIPLTLFAAVMGFSRIYVEVHYCTDVLFGALVGIVYALIGVLIVNKLYPIVMPKIEKKIDDFKEKRKAAKAA